MNINLKNITTNIHKSFIEWFYSIFMLLLIFASVIIFYFGSPYSIHFICIGLFVIFSLFMYERAAKKGIRESATRLYTFLLFYSSYKTFRVLLVAVLPIMLLQFFLNLDINIARSKNLSEYMKLDEIALKIEYFIAYTSDQINFSNIREPLLYSLVAISLAGIIFGVLSLRFSWIWLKSMRIVSVLNLLVFVTGFGFYGTEILDERSTKWKAAKVNDFTRREKILKGKILENYLLSSLAENPLIKTEYARILASISLSVSTYSILPETMREAIYLNKKNTTVILEETSDSASQLLLNSDEFAPPKQSLSVTKLDDRADTVFKAIESVESRNKVLRDSIAESVSTISASLAPDVPDDVLRVAVEESFSAFGEANVEFAFERGGKALRPLALYAHLNFSDPAMNKFDYPRPSDSSYFFVLDSNEIDVPALEKSALIRRSRAAKVPKQTGGALDNIARQIGKFL